MALSATGGLEVGAVASVALIASVALMVAGALGVPSCGTANLILPPTNDGGVDANADTVSTADAGPEATGAAASCAIAHTICDGLRVRKCVGDKAGDVVETCDTACSLGRCTTVACAAIEQTEGTRGCRFYGAQSDNIDSDDDENLMLTLSNARAVPVTAHLDVRDVDGTWKTLTSAVIPSRGGTRIEIVRPMLESGVTANGAFRVETDGPVLVIQIESDDLDRAARSSAGTVLRPLQGLGSDYLAVTAPSQATPEVVRTPGGRGGAGAITIIGTAAETTVHVQLTAPAMVVPGGRLDPPATHDVVLGDGDVLQIFSAAPTADLTGTEITSDFPVAVFSGNVFTTYGYALDKSNGGDMAQEQLPPILSWNTEYIGVRLSPQDGCEPFFGAGAGFWRVVAAKDNTEVTLLPAHGVLIDIPSLPTSSTFKLGKGGSQSFFSRAEIGSSTATDFFVRANFAHPILLAQWLDCEAGLSWGMDTRFAGGDLAFTLPPGFDHEIVVVRKIGASVTFDDQALSDGRWTPVADGVGYEATRLGSDEIGPCLDAYDSCQHHFSGPEFNISWRGMDIVCSYSLTVPSWDLCALPRAACPE